MRVRLPQPASLDISELMLENSLAPISSINPLNLPDDVLFAIFSECDDEVDLVAHQRVNKQWHRVSQDERLWRREAPPTLWRPGRFAHMPQPRAQKLSAVVHAPAPSPKFWGAPLRRVAHLVTGNAQRVPTQLLEPKRPMCVTTTTHRYQVWLSQLTARQRALVFDAYALSRWEVVAFAKEHRNDANICWALVSRWGEAIRFTTFSTDPTLWRLAISNAGFAMEHGTLSQRSSPELARIAVRNHPPSVRFLVPALQDDFDIGVLAVTGDPAAISYLSPRLQAHPDILAIHDRTPPVRTDWYGREMSCFLRDII